MFDVSVIIVNWNTRDILRDCLWSVYKQTKEIDFKVIVVDNASSDGSAEMVKREFPQVRLIENTENRGFAAANNQGMTIAKGRYVLLLNPDTIVLDRAIEKTIAFADGQPEVAVVGCRVLNPDRTLQPTCFMYPSVLNMLLLTTYLSKLFPKSRFFGREQMTWWNRTNVREVDVVTGCFMLVRQEAIKQVGILDERFFMYGEETDWCYRFKEAGWRILFTQGAEIIHIGKASSNQMKPQMVWQLKASILLFFKKHRGRFSYKLACLLVSLFFLLRFPYWLIIAVLSKRMKYSYLQTAKTYATGAIRALLGWQRLCFKK